MGAAAGAARTCRVRVALAFASSSLCCSLLWHSECGLLWANRGQNNSQACLVPYWPLGCLNAGALEAGRKRQFSTTTGVLVTNYYRGTSSPSSRATSFAEL